MAAAATNLWLGFLERLFARKLRANLMKLILFRSPANEPEANAAGDFNSGPLRKCRIKSKSIGKKKGAVERKWSIRPKFRTNEQICAERGVKTE